MCHRDHLNAAAAHEVDETEGITRKHVAACAASVAGPRLRAGSDRLDSLAQFLPEAMRGCAILAAYHSYVNSTSCAAAGWNLTADDAI